MCRLSRLIINKTNLFYVVQFILSVSTNKKHILNSLEVSYSQLQAE